jgi:hypothetical protein
MMLRRFMHRPSIVFPKNNILLSLSGFSKMKITENCIKRGDIVKKNMLYYFYIFILHIIIYNIYVCSVVMI